MSVLLANCASLHSLFYFPVLHTGYANEPIVDFQAELDHLDNRLWKTEGPAVASGNVIAKVMEWDIELKKGRQRLTLEIVAKLGFKVTNASDATSFRRDYGETIPDVGTRRGILDSLKNTQVVMPSAHRKAIQQETRKETWRTPTRRIAKFKKNLIEWPQV